MKNVINIFEAASANEHFWQVRYDDKEDLSYREHYGLPRKVGGTWVTEGIPTTGIYQSYNWTAEWIKGFTE